MSIISIYFYISPREQLDAIPYSVLEYACRLESLILTFTSLTSTCKVYYILYRRTVHNMVYIIFL